MNRDETSIQYHTRRFKETATHPMNPEAKEILLKALRSGDYPQTQGYLQVVKETEARPVGFCCLGVLSEEAEKCGVPNVRSRLSDDRISVIYFGDGDSSTSFLIDSVQEWAQLPEFVSSALMGINDNGGTFEEIADLIEEYL